MTRQKILVITDDAVGKQMAGPAIRAWHIADILADEHEVRLASTRRAEASSPRFAVCDGSDSMLPGLTKGMDIILTQGFTLKFRPWLAHTGALMVVDLYDPIHLETLEGEAEQSTAEHSRRLDGALDALRIQLTVGDFFICASERQRDLWLGHLSALGRINLATYRQDSTLRKLIDIAPFGIDPTPPPVRPAIKNVIAGIDADDTVLLWAGGVYNWFDPVTLVDAVGDLMPTHPRLRLVFMGTKHPSLDDLSTRALRAAIDLAAARGLLDRAVFFQEGWVPYDQRGSYLTDADIGVSTHFLHAETAFSFRTRMLDYLWAGLPIICTEGDEFARLIDIEGLGRVVPAVDRTSLREAIAALVDDPVARAEAALRVAEVAPRYHWSNALRPLVDYCRDPWRAADSPKPPLIKGVRWRSGRSARRMAHAREYIRVNGPRQFVTRGVQRALGVGRVQPDRRAH